MPKSKSENQRSVLTFTNTRDFGDFCVALHKEGIPFTLAGYEKVILAAPARRVLPFKLKWFLRKLKRRGGFVEETPYETMHRSLPTAEEADRLLGQFAEELRSQKYTERKYGI